MKTVHLVIIGHTNTGKTSLMRTLLRNDEFGEVKNESATTRHVEAVTLYDTNDHPLVVLHDTPGLEDASGVMDFLDNHTPTRADGVDRLQVFLKAVQENDERLFGDFSQESKVIDVLLRADIAIYVVDVREPVLSKYKDELAILASSGVPVLPVFNFTNDPKANIHDWQHMLSRRALHVFNAFDTVAFDFDDEMSLWHNLGTLSHHDNFQKLSTQRQQAWQTLHEEGMLLIADFLINVASLQRKIGDGDDPTDTLDTMKMAVRQGFDGVKRELLTLYQFYRTNIIDTATPINGETQDIFDTQLLTRYGIRTAGGGMAGMMIGMGLDMATLGASLGLGTALGGVIGGLLPNATTIKDKALGTQTLIIDDDTLNVLSMQLQNLHYILRHRGHASLNHIDISTDIKVWKHTPTPLKKARAYPNYCSLMGDSHAKRSLRSELAEALSTHLSDT